MDMRFEVTGGILFSNMFPQPHRWSLARRYVKSNLRGTMIY